MHMHMHTHKTNMYTHTHTEAHLQNVLAEANGPVDSLADGIDLGEGARDALQLLGRQETRGTAANQQLALVCGAKEGFSACSCCHCIIARGVKQVVERETARRLRLPSHHEGKHCAKAAHEQ